MNGTMWAESAGEGSGATFVLKSPLKEESPFMPYLQ